MLILSLSIILYNSQVKGFLPIPKGNEWMTLWQFRNPKREVCSWRLSKRRVRDKTDGGNLIPNGWTRRCVACSEKNRLRASVSNARAMEKRHRIKKAEAEFIECGKIVKVNSHDKVAWPLFAQLKKDMITARSEADAFNIADELRKIAIKVR